MKLTITTALAIVAVVDSGACQMRRNMDRSATAAAPAAGRRSPGHSRPEPQAIKPSEER